MNRHHLLAAATALLVSSGAAGHASAADVGRWTFDRGTDGWTVAGSTCPGISSGGFDASSGVPSAGSLFARISPSISLLMDCSVTVRSPRVRDLGPGTLGITTWALPSFGPLSPLAVTELEFAMGYYPNATVRIIGFDSTRQVQDISFISYEAPAPPRGDADFLWYDFDVTLHIQALVSALTQYRIGIDDFHVVHTP